MGDPDISGLIPALLIVIFLFGPCGAIFPSRPRISLAVAPQWRSRMARLSRHRRHVLDGREHDGMLAANGATLQPRVPPEG